MSRTSATANLVIEGKNVPITTLITLGIADVRAESLGIWTDIFPGLPTNPYLDPPTEPINPPKPFNASNN